MDYIIRIRNLREDSDKTQQQIADVLGTSQTMYARYERGANEMPLHHIITCSILQCKYRLFMWCNGEKKFFPNKINVYINKSGTVLQSP